MSRGDVWLRLQRWTQAMRVVPGKWGLEGEPGNLHGWQKSEELLWTWTGSSH